MTIARIGDSGIVLGETDEYGVEWRWNAGSDPWQPGPQLRENVEPRANAHGTTSVADFYEGRSQELRVGVHAPDHVELHRARDRWMAAISRHRFAFTVEEPHLTRSALMRRRGEVPWTEDTPGGPAGGAHASTSAGLWADDPLIYALDPITASTRFPSTTGGLSWPATWPAMWDAQVETGLLSLPNPGSEAAAVRWRIDGPVSLPTVTELASGRRFTLGLDLGPGEWVLVDEARWAVLAEGHEQASRMAFFSGSWLAVPPGGGEYGFSGAAAGENASLSAEYRPAWI